MVAVVAVAVVAVAVVPVRVNFLLVVVVALVVDASLLGQHACEIVAVVDVWIMLRKSASCCRLLPTWLSTHDLSPSC